MPSYRVAIDIHAARPGVAPPSVLPAAEQILAQTHRVEDRSVELVRGQPQIHLRFGVSASNDGVEDDEAEAAVRRLVEALAPYAECGRWVLRRGPGGHWREIRSGEAEPQDPPDFPVHF
ncbi:hypothetical protein [Janibacter sp. GXQ6167]|uniref:hypothetical protein n=1 Tax=Janibacter sp. GXQ6167 TaxID=3240791 RepID=UPI0035249113